MVRSISSQLFSVIVQLDRKPLLSAAAGELVLGVRRWEVGGEGEFLSGDRGRTGGAARRERGADPGAMCMPNGISSLVNHSVPFPCFDICC